MLLSRRLLQRCFSSAQTSRAFQTFQSFQPSTSTATASIDPKVKDPRYEFFADILGTEGEGQGRKQMCAGPLLEQMDLLGAAIAGRHCNSSAVTVSFDKVEARAPVFHGDLIHMEGKLLAVGNSSMTIQISTYRHDMYLKEYVLTHEALITFVALDKDGMPIRNLPRLHAAEERHEEMLRAVSERKAVAMEWKNEQENIDQLTHVSLDMTRDDKNGRKEMLVRMADTVVEVQRAFLPRHENAYHTVFGGEILSWMDRVALYCARNFTRNQNMVTTAMNRITFKRAIHVNDIVQMKARVCHVGEHSLEVEINVRVKDSLGASSNSHTGYFTVLNLGDANQKQRILSGLALQQANQDELKAYLKAKKRLEFNDKDRYSLQLPPIEARSTIDRASFSTL